MELLNATLSPEKHRSLAFSCADRLLLEFADQIFDQQELAIAYPCLNCRGGLSLFLSYLSLAIEQNPPGTAVAPVLVYPGTPRIREAYTGLKIGIGDLTQTLGNIRIRSYGQGEAPWYSPGKKKYPNGFAQENFPPRGTSLHDFFPAAFLESDGDARVFAGRDGFGRGDCIPPPLHFATKIQHVSPSTCYQAALIMHDSIETRTESRRLYDEMKRINSKCIIHLFESPIHPHSVD